MSVCKLLGEIIIRNLSKNHQNHKRAELTWNNKLTCIIASFWLLSYMISFCVDSIPQKIPVVSQINPDFQLLYSTRFKIKFNVNHTLQLTQRAPFRESKTPYTFSVKLNDFYCVTSYLTEKLSKLRNFDRQ
jgi:hypothetical protein